MSGPQWSGRELRATSSDELLVLLCELMELESELAGRTGELECARARRELAHAVLLAVREGIPLDEIAKDVTCERAREALESGGGTW